MRPTAVRWPCPPESLSAAPPAATMRPSHSAKHRPTAYHSCDPTSIRSLESLADPPTAPAYLCPVRRPPQQISRLETQPKHAQRHEGRYQFPSLSTAGRSSRQSVDHSKSNLSEGTESRCRTGAIQFHY